MAKDQPEDLKADIVIANILAGPLRELAGAIGGLTNPNSLLGLSGILASHAEAVITAY